MRLRVFNTLLVVLLLIVSMSPVAVFSIDNKGTNRAINSNNTYSLQSYEASEVVPVSDLAMLQAFYWLTPDNGEWYNMLADKIPELAEAGFGSLWSPPMVKTTEGDIPRGGYEPYDFYDLGEYDQKGAVETRFGSRAELQNMIAQANAHNMAVFADVVINHNRGGEFEWNPIANTMTYTDFSGVASGKFPRNYTHFHPCLEEEEDDYTFADFPDMCHANQYVHDELITWGKWLRDEIGFDAWRFDVAAGINADMLEDWMDAIGGFGIAEYWAGEYSDLTNYLDATDNKLSAFDFYLMYALRRFARGAPFDMRDLHESGLLWDNKIDQAMTFAVNHDTVRQQDFNIDINLHLAYAYILTHQGIPSIFWKDYYNPEFQPFLDAFLEIRRDFAKGDTSILHSDSSTYVMQRNGEPGLILALNNDKTSEKTVEVTTKFKNTLLEELTGHGQPITTDADGKASISIPSMDYQVYGPGEIVADLLPLPDRETHTPPTMVYDAVIDVDAKLDSNWGSPVYMDIKREANNQRDLHNVYLKHDHQFLYIGISHGTHIYQVEQEIQYGIAIDSKDGGTYEETGKHPNIKFNRGEPDHLFYLIANKTDPWGEFITLEGSSYDGEKWSEAKAYPQDYFASDAAFGFVELKIPLEDIDLESGGDISVKIFSTDSTTSNAIDSAPQDNTLLASDGNSWLSMPEPIAIEVNATQDAFLPITFSYVLIMVPLTTIYRMKKTKTNIDKS